MTDITNFDKFLEAKKQFLSDLNDLLIYEQDTKTKYERIYSVEDGTAVVKVYLQRKTRNIVKIYVKLSNFGTNNPIDITVDDDIIRKHIVNLPSLHDMRDGLVQHEESVSQEQLYDRLKHNI